MGRGPLRAFRWPAACGSNGTTFSMIFGLFCAECLQLSISGLDLDARRRGPSDMVARRGFDGPKVVRRSRLDLCPKNFHSAIFDLALPHLARGMGNTSLRVGRCLGGCRTLAVCRGRGCDNPWSMHSCLQSISRIVYNTIAACLWSKLHSTHPCVRHPCLVLRPRNICTRALTRYLVTRIPDKWLVVEIVDYKSMM
jgi:hypothetical protein